MRYGSLIKLKPEWEERYIILHKHTFPGVLDRIRKSHIRNYSIFLNDGMLFSYWDYIGNDYERDMHEIGQDKVTQDWWKLTDPMQEPLETRKEGERWASMDEILHWSEKGGPNEKNRRMAITSRTLNGFEGITVETSDLKDIVNFSVYHKDGGLYSYVEFLAENSEVDIKKLQTSVNAEGELDWAPMEQVFHMD